MVSFRRSLGGPAARPVPADSRLGRADLPSVYRVVRTWTSAAALGTNAVFAVFGGRPELWLTVLVPLPTLIHGLRSSGKRRTQTLTPVLIDATAVGAYIPIAGLNPVTVAWSMGIIAVVAVLAPPQRLRFMFSYIAGWTAVALAASWIYDLPSRWNPTTAAVANVVYAAMPMVVLGVLVTWVMRRLRQVEEERKRLIEGFSHDMKNALTGAVGIAELVADQINTLSPEELAQYATMAVEESREALAMTEDLLVLGRAEAGQLDISTQHVDLLAETTRVVGAAGLGSKIKVVAQDPAQPNHCSADPVRVRQILRNLITNAIRYGGEKVTVSVGVTDTTAFVRVADSGTPIPEVDRERIFDAYQRARHRPHQESVGLGLTISRYLARLMEGNLTYRQADRWSVFELTLPLPLATPGEEAHEPTNTLSTQV
jgi:signal transduction histidine kinase